MHYFPRLEVQKPVNTFVNEDFKTPCITPGHLERLKYEDDAICQAIDKIFEYEQETIR